MSAVLDQNEQHLRLLSVFHYVLGGMIGLIFCFPLIYVVLGVVFLTVPGKLDPNVPPPLAVAGWLMIVFGGFFSLLGWLLALLTILAGRKLANRKNLLFCQVIAGVLCLFMPLGTVLGVFTLIVLMRPSVKPLFDGK